jgi:hypothetical protein
MHQRGARKLFTNSVRRRSFQGAAPDTRRRAVMLTDSCAVSARLMTVAQPTPSRRADRTSTSGGRVPGERSGPGSARLAAASRRVVTSHGMDTLEAISEMARASTASERAASPHGHLRPHSSTSTRTRAWPSRMNPSASAAPWDTSMMMPFARGPFAGPRSTMRTLIER